MNHLRGFLAIVLVSSFSTISFAELIAVADFDGGSPSWGNDIAAQQFVDPNSSNQGLFVGDNAGIGGGLIGSGNTAFARDLGGEPGEPTLSPYTFTFDTIDTSNFQDIVFSFDYYAFANADAGSYQLIIDGVQQTSVDWYDDPDTTAVSGTISVSIGTADSVGLILEGTLNGSSDIFELDNFELNGISNVPEPTSAMLFGTVVMGLAYRRRRG